MVEILQIAGFQGYLVGGCVRDLLAGIHPKDFDIATSASPNEVKRKVAGSYIIGKRFRLVLVKRGEQQFEVATFRRQVRPDELIDENNAITGDNYFGTMEEDARRRDFTINALFYDPISHKLLDYVDGQKDIDGRMIRMIGDPKERFIEDPIRSLRAMRLSHKLYFTLEPELRAAMTATATELSVAVLPRRREEYLKILRLKEPGRVWAELMDMGILEKIMPGLAELYQNQEQSIVFENLLLEIPNAGIDMGSPLELFSAFLYCFIHAKHPEGFNPADIENNPRWIHFMKDELGMFKVEMAVFLKCLELLPSLEKLETYHKKGGRRKLGFLRNESLPLALKMGLLNRSLPTPDYYFWVDEIHRNSEEIWASRPRD